VENDLYPRPARRRETLRPGLIARVFEPVDRKWRGPWRCSLASGLRPAAGTYDALCYRFHASRSFLESHKPL